MKHCLAMPLALCLAAVAPAQVMTEIRVSTPGLDEEYVEIQGAPGRSTDGMMVLVVDGDAAFVGTLDGAYDLSNDVFPDDFYVMGSVSADAAFPGEIDRATFGENLFENSSLTVYLVEVLDPLARAEIGQTWIDSDVSHPPGSNTTRITSDPRITILDAVGIDDGDPDDVFFDGVPVLGPDGQFFPSGVFRNGGCPGAWCTDWLLEFGTGSGAMPPFVDPTPGAVNPSTPCATAPSVGACSGDPFVGAPYCNSLLNSTGERARLDGFGSPIVANNDLRLEATRLPPGTLSIVLVSRSARATAFPGGSLGILCLGDPIGRYDAPGDIRSSGSDGSFSFPVDLASVPQPAGAVTVTAGETWRFQAWYRDAVGAFVVSNFTDGLEITFQ
ncbi:MAG: hypothetical protein AAGB93_12810 [Planctomycetota bacterium]